jgi:hypothetical protein
MATVLAGLVGFVVGVAVMSGYGYAVAFLTLVQEERRAAEPSGKASETGSKGT